MSNFEILCVTMHQTDFSKLDEMNIHSNVVFANQTDFTSYSETVFDGVHRARMISTQTRGVGNNRNIALLYAKGDICLFADDDVCYVDNLENIVVEEFEKNPKADVMIFYLETDSNRLQKKYVKTRKCGSFERMPWGCFRIAFRMNSVKKANLWFTSLFGGGCIFPCGEDSMWLKNAKKAGLSFYVSDKTIGKVSFEKSTWFTGYNEKYYFAKGAYYQASSPKTIGLWKLYFSVRTRKMSNLSFASKIHWMNIGAKCYQSTISYEEYLKKQR